LAKNVNMTALVRSLTVDIGRRHIIILCVLTFLASCDTAHSPAPQALVGKDLYEHYCSACHQADGQGIPGIWPPLAKSDYLMTDKSSAIETVLNGGRGPTVVNGQTYTRDMGPVGWLQDDQIALILSYVLSSWGNQGDPVSVDEVSKVRAKTSP